MKKLYFIEFRLLIIYFLAIFCFFIQNQATGDPAYVKNTGAYEMDEVSVWDKALLQPELQDIMFKTAGGYETSLQGLWKFNETGGTTIYDSSPNANDGSLINMDPVTARIASTVRDFSTDEDQPYSGVLAGSDAEGNILSYSVVSNGTKGSVSLAGTISGTFIYTPHAGESGTDSFTFKVNDGTGDSNAGTVKVTISPVAPTVVTAAVTSVGSTSAGVGGEISDNGGALVTEQGIVWSLTANPTVADHKVSMSTDSASFSETIGLPSGKAIHARAYAINVAGTSYGNDISFNTVAATAPGNALVFDGTDDYIDLGTHIVDLKNYTLEMWIKTSAVGQVIFSCNNNNGSGEPGEKLFYIDNSGKPAFYGYGNNSVRCSRAVNDGRWHHIAITRTAGNTNKIYIDGKDETDAPLSPYTWKEDDTGTFFIGKSGDEPWGFSSFKGEMDEVRIWSEARTQEEIQEGRYNTIDSSPALLASYHFDEGNPVSENTGLDILYDQTSDGYNGTLHNFSLNSTSSNWLESYAMVVPRVSAATDIARTSFTANWSVPEVGTADKYLLDVATDSTFSLLLTDYNSRDVGNATSVSVSGLSPDTVYYYRLRAEKGLPAYVSNTGAYSDIIAVTTAPPITPDSNGIVYVKKNASGNGSSWANALSELADALLEAKTNTNIREIWVASGTYKPAADVNGNTSPADVRQKTFTLVNGIKLYGGFPATGSPPMSDRNWFLNPVILSGDIGTENVNTDNSYHIVTAIDLNTDPVIDGFTIAGAYGDNGLLSVGTYTGYDGKLGG